MKRLLLNILLILTLSISSSAQIKIDIGFKISGNNNLGNKNPSYGMTIRVVPKFDKNVMDMSLDYLPKATKTQTDDGQAISTKIFYRRYLNNSFYMAGGMSCSHLTTNLFSETATNMLMGMGLDLDKVRIQFTYSPKDFTSIHKVSNYDLEVEYLKYISEKGIYLSFRPTIGMSRFTQQRGVSSFYDVLTGSKVAIVVSIGKTF